MRIVVADDASVMRSLLRELLPAAGHAVVAEVTAAQSALAAVRDLRPDALVIDGRLPPEGAIAVLEALAQSPDLEPCPAVYVIAALADTTLVRAARAAGAAGVILRPLVARQIAVALQPPGEEQQGFE